MFKMPFELVSRERTLLWPRIRVPMRVRCISSLTKPTASFCYDTQLQMTWCAKLKAR